jgi:hypothetical protein
MTDRIPLDHLTSDQLDALYYRLESARDATTLHRQGLISTAELYAAIEADAAPTPAATEPREHCGHLSPDTGLSSIRTECALRPGHSGSHADDVGCRWWPITDQEKTDA